VNVSKIGHGGRNYYERVRCGKTGRVYFVIPSRPRCNFERYALRIRFIIIYTRRVRACIHPPGAVKVFRGIFDLFIYFARFRSVLFSRRETREKLKYFHYPPPSMNNSRATAAPYSPPYSVARTHLAVPVFYGRLVI